MEKSVAFEVIVQQRFQELEEKLRSTELRLDEAEAQVSAKEETLSKTKDEVDRLTTALSAVQAEKLKLEFDYEQVKQRDALSRRDSSAGAEVAMQLRTVMQRLDTALSERSVVATSNLALTKELELMKNQLQTKRREVLEMEGKLKDSRQYESSWKEKFLKLEGQMASMRLQLDQKMSQWFEREKETTKALTRMTMERDELKRKLEKRFSDHERTQQVLKTTTEAFGECMSALHAAPEASAQPELKKVDRSFPFGRLPRPVPDFKIVQFKRTSTPSLEPEANLEEITLAELKEKHSVLIQKFNDEMRNSLVDVSNAKKLAQERNQLVVDNTNLALDLSDANKVAGERADEIKSMKEELTQLRAKNEDAQGQKHAQDISLQFLQKTNDDFAAQVKFLVKKVNMYEKASTGADKGQIRSNPLLQRTSSRDGAQPECVHDIVETNRELKRDNYRLKLDVEELNKKIAELEKPKEAEVEIVPVYSEPDDEDTQKRVAAEQAGPSSRKKHKLAGLAFGNPQEDETAKAWREKWEVSQTELSTLKATQLQLETHLKQELERATTQNAVYVKDLKTFEHNLVEYQTKYKSLLDTYNAQGTSFKSQMEAKSSRMKEMDAVVCAMAKEKEDLKKELANQKAGREVDQYKLAAEKRAYKDLQQRTIYAEAEHLEEMKQVKSKLQQQIADNLKTLSAPDDGPGKEKTTGSEAMSEEAARDIYQQLKDKDQVILELERRIQMSTKPLNEDMIYDLQAKLAMAQSQIEIEKEQVASLQKSLLQYREQYEEQMRSIQEEFDLTNQQHEQQLLKVEAECNAASLEIVRWKGRCDAYHTREAEIEIELTAMRVSQQETTNDFRARLKKIQTENEGLRTKLEAKTTELDSMAEQVVQLTENDLCKTEKLKKLEAEKSEMAKGQDERQAQGQSSLLTLTEVAVEEAKKSAATPSDQPDTARTHPHATAMEGIETQTPQSAPAEMESSRPVPFFAGKRDMESLLRVAQRVVATPTQAGQSSDNKPTEQGSVQIQDEVAEGHGSLPGRPSSSAEPSDKQEGNKPKWKPIKYEVKKKDDHGDDKKKDRGSKF